MDNPPYKLYIILSFLAGVNIGILAYATQTVKNTYLSKFLTKSIEQGLTTREVYYTLLPSEYKEQYTDWKTLKSYKDTN